MRTEPHKVVLACRAWSLCTGLTCAVRPAVPPAVLPPQVLFYVRLIGDIAGRMVPRRLQATTARGLLLWAAFKMALVPLLFGCIFTPEATGGDAVAVAVVALFWVLSGYLNTCSYIVAPTLVPLGQKPRASGLMTIAFQSACFGALLLAYWVQQGSTPGGLGHGLLQHGGGVGSAAAFAAAVGRSVGGGAAAGSVVDDGDGQPLLR